MEPKEIVWKKSVAASKSARKAPYTVAAALVGLLLSSKVAVHAGAVCAMVGYPTEAGMLCGISEQQMTMALIPVIAGVMDAVTQYARNYFKHKLGFNFLP